MSELPDLPEPWEQRKVAVEDRPVVLAAIIGGGVALVAVVVGITILGWHSQGVNEVATTGLATIGATLAGGFAGWIARGQMQGNARHRSTDAPRE